MDEVADSGTEIVITKNGRPVSRLVPYREKNFGKDRDKIRILGDIIEPIGSNVGGREGEVVQAGEAPAFITHALGVIARAKKRRRL